MTAQKRAESIVSRCTIHVCVFHLYTYTLHALPSQTSALTIENFKAETTRDMHDWIKAILDGKADYTPPEHSNAQKVLFMYVPMYLCNFISMYVCVSMYLGVHVFIIHVLVHVRICSCTHNALFCSE